MEQKLKEVARENFKGLDQTLNDLGIEAHGDIVFLPHFETSRLTGEEQEYPFHLISYKLMTMAEGRGANQHSRWSGTQGLWPLGKRQRNQSQRAPSEGLRLPGWFCFILLHPG